MSQAEHKARAPHSVRCFIVTVSDTRTDETDKPNPEIADLEGQLKKLVIQRDGVSMLASQLQEAA